MPLFYLNITFNDRRFSALLVRYQQAFDLAESISISRFLDFYYREAARK